MAEEIKKISLANLAYYDEKLKAWIVKSVQNGAAVTIKSDTTTPGALKSYTIMQADQLVGTIDIPKDMVVQSGTVEVNPTGQPAGTYMVLTLANATNDKLYINVGSLVDIYTAKQSATQVQLAINSTTREISATLVNDAIDTQHIKNKAITIDKLSDAVKQLIEETAKKVGGGAVYLEPTATSAGVWTATTDKIEAYENGQQIMIKCPEARSGSTTIDINNLGAKKLYQNSTSNSVVTTTGNPMLFVYNATKDGFVQLIDNNTTYSNATKTSNGLMSQQDKTFVDSLKEKRLAGFGTTQGTGAAYTVSIDGLTELIEGTTVAIKFHTTNTSTTPTLNINNLGAKTIHRVDGSSLSSYILNDNSVHLLVYDGTKFIAITLLNNATASRDGLLSKVSKDKLDKLVPRQESIAIATTTDQYNYVAAISGVNLTVGTVIYLSFSGTNNTSNGLTLNINGLGAKTIQGLQNNGSTWSQLKRVPIGVTALIYNGTQWCVLGNVELANVTTTANGLMSKEDKQRLDELKERISAYATTGGTGNEYTIVRTDISQKSGTALIVTFDRECTGNVTIKINNEEAKPLYRNGSQVNNDYTKIIKAGDTNLIVYDGTKWIVVDTDQRYTNATTSRGGLLSSTDKERLDGLYLGKANYGEASLEGTSIWNVSIPAVTKLTTGTIVYIKTPGSHATGNLTLKINSLDPKTIEKESGGNLTGEDVNIHSTYMFMYTGSFWRIIRPSEATQAKSGLMSALDKQTVDSIPTLLTEIEQLLAEV